MLGLVLLTSAFQFRVELPVSIASEQVFLEYCLYDQATHCSWISPIADRSYYMIDGGPRVRYLKAILYVPGCALETFTVELPSTLYQFTCRPFPTVFLAGEIAGKSPHYAELVELNATYTAPWATSFFGTPDALTNIPLGKAASITDDNHFRFVLPDFASDPVTAPGFLYIWAKEKTTGKLVALLVPEGAEKKINSLKVQQRYPANLVFHPCSANAVHVHDKEGFTIRSADDPCLN